MARDAEAARLRRKVEGAGGVFIRQTTHGYLYRLPSGEQIMTPTKVSGGRAMANIRSMLRRAGVTA